MIPLWGISQRNQQMVKAVANGYHAHTDYALAGMFSAAAAMLGKRCHAKIENFDNYGNLWIAAVGRTSAKKSETTSWFLRPILRHEAEVRNEHLKAMSAWRAAIRTKEGADEPMPVYRHTVENNTTDEQMLRALSENDAIMWYADELRLVFGLMGRYTKNGSASAMESNMLSIFSYKSLMITRKSQDPMGVEEPCLTVMGTIQPDVLGDIMRGRNGDGMFQRFIYIWPDAVKRERYQIAAQLDGELQQWEDEVRRLQQLSVPHMCVTPEAAAIYENAKDRWDNMVAECEETDPMLASLIDKMGYHLCRWAIVASALSDTPGTIGGDIMRYSFECCEVFIDYGTRALRLFQEEPRPKEPKRMTQKALFTELFSRFPDANVSKVADGLGVLRQNLQRYDDAHQNA